MTDRTERLKQLMEDHALTTEQVGEMLGRTAQTVRCWRCRWESRAIPEHALTVLELKLSAKGGAAA